MPTIVESETKNMQFNPEGLSKALNEDIKDLKAASNGKPITMTVRLLNPQEEGQTPDEHSFLITHLGEISYDQEDDSFMILYKKGIRDTDFQETRISINSPMCFLFKPQTKPFPLYISDKNDPHSFRRI